MNIPDPNAAHIVNLLLQLQHLTEHAPDTTENATRITLRDMSGDFVGELLLPATCLDALADAVTSLNSYVCDHGIPHAEPEIAGAPALHLSALDDLEAHFAGLDTDTLMADAEQSADPDAAAAAYEWLVLGQDEDPS